LINKYNKSVDSIKSQELAIEKVKQQLEGIQNGSVVPSSLRELNTQLKQNQNELNKVTEKINQLSQKKLKTSVNEAELQRLQQAQVDLKQIISEVGEEMSVARSSSTEVQQLSSKLENMNSKLSQTKDEANQTKDQIKEMLNQKSNILGGSIDEINKKIGKFGKRLTSLMSAQLVFNVLSRGITSLKNSLSKMLKTDNQFSSSLNQIKANLMIAFAPIYNAVLPAINTLMSALSRVTGTIATFVSNLFGKSLSDSTKQAKKLSDALDDTAKSGEEANGSLSSFDKLEVIGSENSSGSSQNSDKIDYSGDIQTSSILLSFLDRIKVSLSGIDFTNLNTSLGILWQSLSQLGNIVGGALWWLWDNVLVPLAQWTIEDVLPAFLGILSGALNIVNQACTDLQPIWQWFWDNVLSPIAEWTGGIIVDILTALGDALNWISQNEVAMAIIEGVAIAIGLVSGALALYNGAMVVCNVVTGIFAGIMTALTSPITLVIAILGALIAIIILCIKNWDTIKETAVNCWNTIKSFWSGVAKWFDNNIVQPIANLFSGLWNGLINGASIAWNGIKNVFSTVVSFFRNIFTNAWTAVKNVFSVGGKIFDGIKEGIVDAFKAVVNVLIRGINKVVATPFNGLNGVLDKIQNTSFLGISPFKWVSWRASVPKIPELAKGTVIPPRQKFMAILGDQKHGTNIEAPLETIKQANREVLQEFMGALMGLNNNEREIVFKNLTIVAQFGNKDFSKLVVEAVRLAEKELGKQLFVS